MGRNKILVINGANMDLLGKRDQKALSSDTLMSVMGELIEYGSAMGIGVTHFQSNMEGDIINLLHEAGEEYDAVIINPGSFGHYSIGLKEAVDAVGVPCIEVHLANFFRKPENRSVLAPVCSGVVCGFGKETYKVALDAIVKMAQ